MGRHSYLTAKARRRQEKCLKLFCTTNILGLNYLASWRPGACPIQAGLKSCALIFPSYFPSFASISPTSFLNSPGS